MPALDYLADNVGLFIGLCFIFGCVIGSFLNVVIYRLPVMMQRAWRQECAEFLEQPAPALEPAVFNLAKPDSTCPHCGHQIRAWENIPVLSWLALKGRCAGCNNKISVRYPLVELTAGVLSALVAWQFGASIAALCFIGFSLALLTLALIDADTMLLPDSITLPLLWAGVLAALLGWIPVSLADSVIGAIAGYLVLWSFYWAFKLIRGKEGMGYGDFKLLAAIGAWLGWQALGSVVILSAFVGAAYGIISMLLAGRDGAKPMPFGPYLAGAGILALLFGEPLQRLFLGGF